MSFRSRINRIFTDSPALAVACAITGCSFIALSPVFVRFSEVGSTATAFYRFFFGLPIVWVWMVFDSTKSLQPRTPRGAKDYFLMVACGIFLGLDITFWHLSMTQTSVVNAILLNALTPVIVALATWVIFREKVTLPLFLGILLALVGAYLLVTAKVSGKIAGSLKGDLNAFLSAFFYAGFMITSKELRKTFATPTILFWVTLSGMYVLAVNAFFMNEVVVPYNPSGWLLLVALALVVHIFGGGLLNYSMGHLSATFSSLTALVGPLVAALIGTFVFDEPFTLQMLIGGLIVIGGIVLSRQRRLTFSRKS